MRRLEQHLLIQEQDARRPRLAMEADQTANTKTQERTEGPAKAVQVRGDSCTAEQKVQDGPKTSITFGVEAEPPDLPAEKAFWSRRALRRPSRVSHSWRCAHQHPGGLVPAGKASTATETNFDQPSLRFCFTEMGLEAICEKIQLHTSRTTAAASGDCLLLPTAEGSLRPNPGKIGPLIQAVRKITSAPAYFWNRGTRWFW